MKREHHPPLIVLVGPTAVGKSDAAVRLAGALGSEIISADSRMVYRGMDIGTAKPRPSERGGIVHHLIDVADPADRFSAGRFREMASAEIARLHEKRQIPIVVGGTGLYVRLLLHGLWKGPEADPGLRARLYEAERSQGPGHLHRRLQKIDPVSAARIEPRDRHKIIRAIEVYEKTGRPLSAFHREHGFSEEPYRAIQIGLRRARPDLYRRIEARVDEMIAEDLVAEVRGLLDSGHSPELPSMKGLGYRQIVGHLNGEYDLPEAVRRLKRDTQRFAKRQFTWFNRDPSIHWIDLAPSDGAEEAYGRMEALIEKKRGPDWN